MPIMPFFGKVLLSCTPDDVQAGYVMLRCHQCWIAVAKWLLEHDCQQASQH